MKQTKSHGRLILLVFSVFSLLIISQLASCNFSTPTTYTLTFDLNGGSGTVPSPMTVEEGTTVTLPTPAAREGYTFLGWAKSTGEGSICFTKIKLIASCTLYAVWKEKVSCTITFDLNGGSGTAPSSVTVDSGTTVTLPTPPARDGYTFQGWAKSTDAGALYFTDSFTPSASCTLYAVWEEDTGTDTGKASISFEENGTYGYQAKELILPETFKTETGDKIKITIAGTTNVTMDYLRLTLVENGENTGSGWGWVTLSGTETLGSNITTGTAFSYSTTITATSTSSSAGVNYNRVVFECGTGTASAPTLTLTKYTYEITKASASKDASYTVTFNTNGGSGTAPSSVTVDSGESVTLPTTSDISSITNEGYTFKGWSTSAYGAVISGTTYTPTESCTLYMSWKVASSGADSIADISSVQMATNMKIGFNLGNTLDASVSSTKSNQGLVSEISWLPDYDGDGSKTDNYTTQANIQGIKNAGFDTIRIPVSWHNHITDENYTIDSAWMTRVKEVVDWAYDAGLYIILNVHHDNMSLADIKTTYGYCVDSSYKSVSNAYLEAVWTQIANTFNNDYDEHLVFELLNEPRCVDSSCEWWVGDNTTPTATVANGIITEYEKTSLDAVRGTGGNNASRFVMVPAYAGSSSCISTYSLPSDSADDKLIFSYHAYSPYNFAMLDNEYPENSDTSFDSTDKSSLDSIFSSVKNKFPNIGVVIGESGVTNKNNLEERVKWTSYYFGTAYKTYNQPTILWDNGAYEASTTEGEKYGYYDRSDNSWYFPSIIEAAVEAVGKTASDLDIAKSSNSPE